MTRAQLEKLRIATAEPHTIVGARRFVEVEVDDLKAALAVIDKAVAGARGEGDAGGAGR